MGASQLFDAYLMVDWSAASRPKRGKDSIWFAYRQGARLRLENASTRAEAFQLCLAILRNCTRDGRRLLVGVDFSLSFPAGTARAMGVTGWRGLWDELSRSIQDAEDNHNNRFAVAAEWNRRMTGSAAPFWGCPRSQVSSLLRTTSPVRPSLPLLRACEQSAGARSTWQLYYNGSVGSQTLLGIPWLDRLRNEPSVAGAIRIWPLETGFEALANALVTVAEVYPSLLAVKPRAGEVKDAAQVRTLAAQFSQLDREGRLGALFAPPDGLPPAQLAIAQEEEGWILGVR